jgi:hypothetical protein
MSKPIFQRHRALACAAAVLALLATGAHAGPAGNADQILADSDKARGGNLNGVKLKSTITEINNGKPGTTLHLDVLSDQDNSLVVFTEPPRVRGNKMLIQGRNMWFATQDVIKPVPISPRQRMLGEASNGDIAVTRYSRDYNATLAGEEILDGKPVWVLDLRAKGSGVAYDQVKYFIDKKSLLGLRADFHSVSGDLLKSATMEYGNSVEQKGARHRFISKIEISDALAANKKTVLEYSEVRTDDIPSSTFNLADLTRR